MVRWKITGVVSKPGEFHDLAIEVMDQGGNSFPTPVTFTVEVAKDAGPDEIKGAVRHIIRGKVPHARLVGKVFAL